MKKLLPLFSALSLLPVFLVSPVARAQDDDSDQVGVTSDTFYADESLNNNGEWINVKNYGRCWQPTNVSKSWRPYTRGSFRHNDEGGWTWVSDPSEEEWGWAVFHYGRWLKLDGVGCGWAWVPGTVWGGAWVSWRNGQTPDCTCVGWAPLPPEAPCRVNVGISRWVDKTYDIGPDYYTFVHVKDFGSDNYDRCGCVLERRRYVNIIEHTVNITNISFTRVNVNVNVNVHIGGPDLSWCNTYIRQGGGREIASIRINRFDDPGWRGKRWEGNVLNLRSPRVFATVNSKFIPKIKINIGENKVDRGWKNIDLKVKTKVKNQIADQTKGLTPENTKATAPDVVTGQKLIFDKDGKPLNDAAKNAGNAPDVVTGQKLIFDKDGKPLNDAAKNANAAAANPFGAAGPAGKAEAVPGFDSEKSESAMGEAWKNHVAKNGYTMPTDPALVNAIKYEAAANKTTPEKIVGAYADNANKKAGTAGNTGFKNAQFDRDGKPVNQDAKDAMNAADAANAGTTGFKDARFDRDGKPLNDDAKNALNATGPGKTDPGMPKVGGANAGNVGNVDWKAQVKGDGKDAFPTDPATLTALKADAARQGVPPDVLFNQFAT